MADDGTSRRVYLDHNATSPLRPEAEDAVLAALRSGAGNASSLHGEGRAARAILETARERVARFAGVPAGRVVFTSGGTEAIAAAVQGVCDRAPAGKRRIVVSSVEHVAVLGTARASAARGFRAETVPCDRDGVVDAGRFVGSLGPDVALAAVQRVNNETGVIQPTSAVARACRAASIPLLIDAVQAAGKIDLADCAEDAALVVLSGHKIGGPQGTGALLVREEWPMSPLLHGGAQERRRRGGTEAVAMLAGFGAAAEAAARSMVTERARLETLRDRIEEGLRSAIPSAIVHGSRAQRVAQTVCVSVPGVSGEMLAIALDVAGFAVSTGSACSSGSVEPSHVLSAMGCSDAETRGAIRVSLGWTTSADDVDRFLSKLPDVVARVRRAS